MKLDTEFNPENLIQAINHNKTIFPEGENILKQLDKGEIPPMAHLTKDGQEAYIIYNEDEKNVLIRLVAGEAAPLAELLQDFLKERQEKHISLIHMNNTDYQALEAVLTSLNFYEVEDGDLYWLDLANYDQIPTEAMQKVELLEEEHLGEYLTFQSNVFQTKISVLDSIRQDNDLEIYVLRDKDGNMTSALAASNQAGQAQILCFASHKEAEAILLMQHFIENQRRRAPKGKMERTLSYIIEPEYDAQKDIARKFAFDFIGTAIRWRWQS